jgi:hypothetical protein
MGGPGNLKNCTAILSAILALPNVEIYLKEQNTKPHFKRFLDIYF